MGGNIMITIGCLVAYFILILWAAFFTKTGKMKESSMEEFAVGGRNFGLLMVLFVIMGAMVTASIFTSFFSWAGTDGLFVQYVLIYATLGFLFTYVFSKKIWIWGREFKLLTQPDYIQLRYNCRPLTFFFAAAEVLIEFPWVVMEFAALGILMSALTYGALSPQVGAVIIAVVIISYILYSGMKAIAVTELIQGLLSSLVIAAGMIFVIYKLFGGFGNLYQEVMAVAPENLLISRDGQYSYTYWACLITTSSIGVMGFCTFFTRIYTSKSVLETKRIAMWSAIVTFIFFAFLFIAALGVVVYPDLLEEAIGEGAFYAMLDKAYGPWFLGLGGIVVVAAGMSLISVANNTLGIIVAENLIRPFRKKQPASEKEANAQRVKIARICVFVFSIVAVGVSMLDLPNLYEIAIVTYEGISQVVPMIVFSLYWRRSNKYGALFGFLSGVIVAISFTALGIGGAFTGGFIALFVNIIVHFVCGFIFPKDPHVDELFDMVENYEEQLLDDDKSVKEIQA